MTRPLIKVCGIQSAQMAQAAVEAGADMIGVICHPDSKRYVDCLTAESIAAATRAVGGVTVAVFVDHNVVEIREFCEKSGVDSVQLHGDNARTAHAALPKHYQRIYACPVGDNGIRLLDLARIKDCDVHRDFVLFDHEDAGSGQLFSWKKLAYTGGLRMGIAGGLNKDNVGTAIATFHPAFVDISSGVENLAGEKEIGLIREFIGSVRSISTFQRAD